MPGDFLLRTPQLTMDEFHAFRDERPKEEKWELIDGVPIMMPPPTLVHQQIADNLNLLLNVRLREVKPEWRAVRDAGVLLEGDEKYNPEPDVTIIDARRPIGQIYAERFYIVSEVLSASDKKAVVAAKLRYYQDHEHNRCILLVRQDRIGAEQHWRQEGTWRARRLSSATSKLSIAHVGVIGRLGDLYEATPLDPFPRPPASR